MKKILYILLATAFAISCSEFKIYDTPYPNSATVNLSAEWTTLHEGDTAPTEFAILNNGTQQKVSAETVYILDPTTDNDFIVYNLPSGFTISGGVATLNNLSTNPEHLYYGTGSTTLVSDTEQDIKVTTHRATAPLTIKLNYVASEVLNVSSAVIELSGIAQTRDLSSGALSNAGTLTHNVSSISAAESTLTLNYTILGTVGDSQELKITFTTTDNQTIIVTSELNSQLGSFNSNMNSVSLTGDLNLPTDLETEGSIVGWSDFVGGSGTAK